MLNEIESKRRNGSKLNFRKSVQSVTAKGKSRKADAVVFVGMA